MLYEDDIVKAVCDHLKLRGYIISQSRCSIQRGDDIIAKHPSGLALYIEAKGETSAQKNSARFGRPFTRSQVLVHVGQALYRAAVMLQQTSTGCQRRVGIAFPDSADHRERINAIANVLGRVGIAVFWVQPDHSVTVESQPTLPGIK